MSFRNKLKNITLLFLGIDPGIMKLYYVLIYKPKPGSISAIIDQKAKNIKDFRFLQIGGNDGFFKDPIFIFIKRYSWKGIIVEPQKEVFTNRLLKTYRFEKNLILENTAIAEKKGVRKLFKLGISDSRWATGLATFDLKTLEHQIKRNYVYNRAKREGIKLPEKIKDYIISEDVYCTTIEDLMIKHNFKSIELLQIDTEGFDFEIIKTINFSVIKPTMISFENMHLSRSDVIECEKLLKTNGYIIYNKGRDSIAYLER